MKQIKLDIGCVYIIAETYEYDEFHEMNVYLEDKEGYIQQDIAMVRETGNSDAIECLVWSDEHNDDYVHKFTIPIRKAGE